MRNISRNAIAGGLLSFLVGCTSFNTDRVDVSNVKSGSDYAAQTRGYNVPVLSPLTKKANGIQERTPYFVKSIPAGMTAKVGDEILPRTSTMGVYLCELANSEFDQENGEVTSTGNGKMYFPVNVIATSPGVTSVNTGAVKTTRITIGSNTNSFRPYTTQTGKNSSVVTVSPSREDISTVNFSRIGSHNYLVIPTLDSVYSGTNSVGSTNFMLVDPTEGAQRTTTFDSQGNAREKFSIRGNISRPVEGKLVKIPYTPTPAITNTTPAERLIFGSVDFDALVPLVE